MTNVDSYDHCGIVVSCPRLEMWALFKAAGVVVCMLGCYLEVKDIYTKLCSVHFVCKKKPTSS